VKEEETGMLLAIMLFLGNIGCHTNEPFMRGKARLGQRFSHDYPTDIEI